MKDSLKRDVTIVARINKQIDKKIRKLVNTSYDVYGHRITISTFVEQALIHELKALGEMK